jgi:hypothetical protein
MKPLSKFQAAYHTAQCKLIMMDEKLTNGSTSNKFEVTKIENLRDFQNLNANSSFRLSVNTQLVSGVTCILQICDVRKFSTQLNSSRSFSKFLSLLSSLLSSDQIPKLFSLREIVRVLELKISTKN